MPSIAGNGSPPFAVDELKRTKAVKVEKSGEVRASGDSTPGKRRLRSNSAAAVEEDGGPIATTPSPTKWKSPRRCVNGTPNSPANAGVETGTWCIYMCSPGWEMLSSTGYPSRHQQFGFNLNTLKSEPSVASESLIVKISGRMGRSAPMPNGVLGSIPESSPMMHAWESFTRKFQDEMN